MMNSYSINRNSMKQKVKGKVSEIVVVFLLWLIALSLLYEVFIKIKIVLRH